MQSWDLDDHGRPIANVDREKKNSPHFSKKAITFGGVIKSVASWYVWNIFKYLETTRRSI